MRNILDTTGKAPRVFGRGEPISQDRQCLAASCPAGRNQADYPIRGQPGLSLRVSANGEKSWCFRYRRPSDSKQRRLTIGRYPDMGLEAARVAAEKLRPTVREGVDPAGDRRERRAAMTFTGVVEQWRMWADRNKSPNARTDDESMLRVHILPAIGAMKAAEITKDDIIALRNGVAAKPDARVKHGKSRTTTHRSNRVLELVRGIFGWALSENLLEHDPTHRVKMLLENEPVRDRHLTESEIAIYWNALDKAPVKRRYTPRGTARGEPVREIGDVSMTRAIAIAAQLALVIGHRITEVTGIELRRDVGEGKNARSVSPEFDFSVAALPVIVIPGWRKHGRANGRTKNGHDSRVPLTMLALQLIGEARKLAGQEAKWLFPNAEGSGPINRQSATKAMERSYDALAALGIVNFRIHDMRTTASTHMARLGVQQEIIDKALNHVRREHYNHHAYDHEKKDALGKWAAEIERIIAVKPIANRAEE